MIQPAWQLAFGVRRPDQKVGVLVALSRGYTVELVDRLTPVSEVGRDSMGDPIVRFA